MPRAKSDPLVKHRTQTETAPEPETPTEVCADAGLSAPSTAKKESDAAKQTAYDKCVGELRDMDKMTATMAWRKFYEFIKVSIRTENEALINEDGTREMIHHQEAIRVYRDLIDLVTAPLVELELMEEAAQQEPLFPFQHEVYVHFDDATGVLAISDTPF